MTLIVLNTILLMLKVNPALSTTSKVANNMNLQCGFDRELSSYFGTNCKGRGIVQSLNIIQGRRMKQKLWSVSPSPSSSSPLNPNDQRSLFPPSPPFTYMSHFLLLKTKHVISPLGRPCVCFFCRLWPIQRVFSQGKQPNNFWGNLHVFCRHSPWEFQIEELTNCWTWQARVVIFRILGQSRI